MNIAKPNSVRRYDLDWMRVFIILVIFIFHTGRFFDLWQWHVKNPTTYEGMQMWSSFLSSWTMPFVFFISGASLYFAIGKSTSGKFFKDKVLRLLVPLLVGIFSHIAIAVYLERLTHRQFFGSFWEFFPRYFDGLYGEGGNFAWMGLHLWYLLVLFVFSLLFYPLFLILKTRAQAVLQGIGNFFVIPGMVYLLAIPVIWLSININPNSIFGDRSWGGWSLLSYIPFFLYGFLIISHDGLQETICRFRWVSVFIAVVVTAALIYASALYPFNSYGTSGYNLVNGLFALTGWVWILLLLGFSLKRMNFTNPFLAYANESVLPFYILHQTVLLMVGYFVVQWQIPDALKFIVILTTSFAFIMLIYEFLIRRNNVMRFLFGMKPIAKVKSVDTTPVALPKVEA